MRKLVSIRKISELAPIDNADAIEVATVDGWRVVVKKGEFIVGEQIIYCEIDSWIPTEIAPFLTKPGHFPRTYNEVVGEKLKTVRLREQISQGLILPINTVLDKIYDGAVINGKTIEILTKDVTTFKFTLAKDRISIKKNNYTEQDMYLVKFVILDMLNVDTDFEEFETVRGKLHWVKADYPERLYYLSKGSSHTKYFNLVKEGITKIEDSIDITKVLGFQKWEPNIDVSLAGLVKGNFPRYIQKTDEERIQNLYNKYKDRYKDMMFRPTLKLDGTSCTYYAIDAKRYITKSEEPIEHYFGHCSRNLDKKDPGEGSHQTPWKLAYDYKIKENLLKYVQETGESVALQGELMGAKIQGNRENLQQPEFYLFKIWNIDKQRYFSYDEKQEFLKKTELTHLKHVPTYEPLKLFSVFSSLQEILDFAEGPSINHPIREGLVFESVDELENGGIISFKAISNKFLLKEKD